MRYVFFKKLENISSNGILFYFFSFCPFVCPYVCLFGSSWLCGTTEPSAAESQGKCSISEDELITAIKEAKGLSYETTESPRSAGQVVDRPEAKARSGLPTIPSPLDHEASSAESGDSEIELVSEDPLAAEDALPSGYVTFGHVGGPPPSPASPSIQYSILREEREAELDSELIIESCDASSASEESPKREQDSPLMKPGALDAIREEPGARAEEHAPSQRGLVEFPSAIPQTGPKLPPGDGAPASEEPSLPPKPVETASSDQSSPATGVPGPLGPGVAPPLLFLNKQKGKMMALLSRAGCLLTLLCQCSEVSSTTVVLAQLCTHSPPSQIAEQRAVQGEWGGGEKTQICSWDFCGKTTCSVGVPLWPSGLNILCCHCRGSVGLCGAGLVPGLGTSTSHRRRQTQPTNQPHAPSCPGLAKPEHPNNEWFCMHSKIS